MGRRLERDSLDHAVLFLQKRDGVDKALKIARYTAKFILATALADSNSKIAKGVKNFESSVGTSRKAFRLGKFLQDVNVLRGTSLHSVDGLLELLASGGEGLYFFVEQFVWLVKAGAIHKRHGPVLQKLSAWFEIVGYVGSVTLKALQYSALITAETAIICELRQKNEATGGYVESCSVNNSLLLAQLSSCRDKKTMKLLSVTQDLADSLLALNDVGSGKGLLARPSILAAAGLLSALISAHKNWISL